MYFYPQENRMQKCTYLIDNIIYMYNKKSKWSFDIRYILMFISWSTPFCVENYFYSVLLSYIEFEEKLSSPLNTERILLCFGVKLKVWLL